VRGLDAFTPGIDKRGFSTEVSPERPSNLAAVTQFGVDAHMSACIVSVSVRIKEQEFAD
jgi:hypothetical protein